MKHIKEPISKIRDAIKFLNAKNSRIQTWVQTCKHNCVAPRWLKVDVETLWNSTYLTLDKVIQYKEIFTMWINNQLKAKYLMKDDWTIAEIMNTFLNTFDMEIVSLSFIHLLVT